MRSHLPNRQAWALTRIYLAGLDFEEGKYEDSLRGFREALAVYAEIGSTGEVALALEGMVLLAAMHEQPNAALQLAGTVAAIRARTRFLPAPANARHYRAAIERASSAVTPAQRAASMLIGRSLSRESALAYALSLPPDVA